MIFGLHSHYVGCLLSDRLTALRPTGYRDELRRFRPGLDYTVAHHGAMTVTARLDATLCFVDDDRITLLDENENEKEDGEHEQKGEDKKGNKPIEPAKKGLYSHLYCETPTRLFLSLDMREKYYGLIVLRYW